MRVEQSQFEQFTPTLQSPMSSQLQTLSLLRVQIKNAIKSNKSDDWKKMMNLNIIIKCFRRYSKPTVIATPKKFELEKQRKIDELEKRRFQKKHEKLLKPKYDYYVFLGDIQSPLSSQLQNLSPLRVRIGKATKNRRKIDESEKR